MAYKHRCILQDCTRYRTTRNSKVAASAKTFASTGTVVLVVQFYALLYRLYLHNDCVATPNSKFKFHPVPTTKIIVELQHAQRCMQLIAFLCLGFSQFMCDTQALVLRLTSLLTHSYSDLSNSTRYCVLQLLFVVIKVQLPVLEDHSHTRNLDDDDCSSSCDSTFPCVSD